MDLRSAAADLARAAAARDYAASQAGLLEVASACNRCHQAFRVDVTVRAFAEPKP